MSEKEGDSLNVECITRPSAAVSLQPLLTTHIERNEPDPTIAQLQLFAASIKWYLGLAGSPGVTGPVLHAFAAWLRLSAGAGLDGAALVNHSLTKAAMEGLRSVDTFEDASDAVCELVMCTSTRGEPEQQMMPLVQLLVPAVSCPIVTLVMLFEALCHQARYCLAQPDSLRSHHSITKKNMLACIMLIFQQQVCGTSRDNALAPCDLGMTNHCAGRQTKS